MQGCEVSNYYERPKTWQLNILEAQYTELKSFCHHRIIMMVCYTIATAYDGVLYCKPYTYTIVGLIDSKYITVDCAPP